MQESCSSGSVGERGGNKPLYPELEGFNSTDVKEMLKPALRAGF